MKHYREQSRDAKVLGSRTALAPANRPPIAAAASLGGSPAAPRRSSANRAGRHDPDGSLAVALYFLGALIAAAGLLGPSTPVAAFGVATLNVGTLLAARRSGQAAARSNPGDRHSRVALTHVGAGYPREADADGIAELNHWPAHVAVRPKAVPPHSGATGSPRRAHTTESRHGRSRRPDGSFREGTTRPATPSDVLRLQH